MAGEANEFYVEYFQEPGRAEAEIEADVRQWLLGFYWCASGDVRDGPNISIVPRGTKLRDKFVYPADDAEMAIGSRSRRVHARVRVLRLLRSAVALSQRRSRLGRSAGFADRPITIPALFVGGSRDGPTIWGRPTIERFPETLPKLFQSEIIDGAGHWIQQEAAPRTNELLIEFLRAIH